MGSVSLLPKIERPAILNGIHRFKSQFLFIIILSLLQLGVVTISSAQPEKKDLAIEIMEKSGMNEQIRQLPLNFSSALSLEDNLPQEFQSILKSEGQKAMDPERIAKEISRQTENNLDLKSMRAVLSWLESDLGQKITSMEKSSAKPEELQGMAEFADQLKKTPASKKRSALVQRLIKASHLIEIEVDTFISMALIIATEVNLALPEGKPEDIEEIKKGIEALRPLLQRETRKRVTAGNLYVYRTLKDEEFQRYVEFMESESGIRYRRVIASALKDAMKMIFFDFAKALRDLYKKFPCMGDRVISREFFVHMKNGGTLTWNNFKGRDDWCCTWLAYGEFCVKKDDISSIEPR